MQKGKAMLLITMIAYNINAMALCGACRPHWQDILLLLKHHVSHAAALEKHSVQAHDVVTIEIAKCTLSKWRCCCFEPMCQTSMASIWKCRRLHCSAAHSLAKQTKKSWEELSSRVLGCKVLQKNIGLGRQQFKTDVKVTVAFVTAFLPNLDLCINQGLNCWLPGLAGARHSRHGNNSLQLAIGNCKVVRKFCGET